MYLGNHRRSIILFLYLFLSSGALSQTGNGFKYHFNGDLKGGNIGYDKKSISIVYSLPEIDIDNITTENSTYYRLTAPGHSLTSEPGSPELPVFTRLITVPEGSSVAIKISHVKAQKIRPKRDNIKGILFPAQYGTSKQEESKRSDFVINKKLYDSKTTILTDTVKIESIGKIRGNQIANLVISPVRYNPRLNVIEVITSMEINISFEGGINKGIASYAKQSSLFDEMLDKGILNYYPENLITGYSEEPVGMIILTDTAFRKQIQPLVDWKTQKGFKLKVIYKGEGSNGSTYSELKNTISGIYSTEAAQGHAPEYLLIIGDVSKIPYFGTDNITDMYYGEFDGNGDYLPEMFIGRIPAPDTASLKSAVQKIIQYEKFEFDDSGNFLKNALIFAGKDATYATYMNGQIRYATSNYLTPENKILEHHFFYPEGSTKKDSIMKLISSGLSFVNYTGHGSEYGWLHVEIKSSDIKSLTNRNMYPFIISNACRTAQYNDTASFGNKMLLSAEKGAVGFIGCSNDSYWDEDFIWSVGQGTPNSDPKYALTGLGALDRLFHTHDELPSDWYISMGQVNYAGNLAVSASSSLKKKYYWETYSVIGDPSLIPYIGSPTPFTVSIPDTLPNAIKSVSFTLDPFAYVAVSHSGTLWDASHASPSGTVVLELPGISNDSCLIVITGQNKIPLIKTIHFSEIDNEYVNLSGSEINDSDANNNGKADFGETLFLKLKISNLGLVPASNLSATISCTSPWITIITNNVSIGTLAAKSEVVLADDLQLKIADFIPDQGIVTIELTLRDIKTVKKYQIDFTIHSPDLEIVNCIIDDSLDGNNNSIADPGESFDLIFQVTNNGTSNTSGKIIVTTNDSNLEVIDSDVKSGVLQSGITSDIPVTVKLSESALHGEFISFTSSLDCSPYMTQKIFQFRVGRIRESFESGTFTVFPWINLSSKPWTISHATAFDGVLSARSGSISHNANSVLILRTYFPEPDSLKFYYKVSSELNYDYFQFNLNGAEIVRKSGETNWIRLSVPVPAGYNKMEWIYKKDNTVSQGADAAWIDLIDFSGSARVDYIKNDLEVARIVTPVQKEIYGQELVTVKVLNVGTDTLNGFNLAYSINNTYPVIQNFKDKIAPYQDSVTLTFEKRADLDLSGIYEISVFGYDNNDDYRLNDTLKVKIENTDIEESLTVFPNPFTSGLNVTINSRIPRRVRVSLVNLAGKEVFTEQKELIEGENQVTINTDNISPSMYILNITGGGYLRSVPLVKLKR